MHSANHHQVTLRSNKFQPQNLVKVWRKQIKKVGKSERFSFLFSFFSTSFIYSFRTSCSVNAQARLKSLVTFFMHTQLFSTIFVPILCIFSCSLPKMSVTARVFYSLVCVFLLFLAGPFSFSSASFFPVFFFFLHFLLYLYFLFISDASTHSHRNRNERTKGTEPKEPIRNRMKMNGNEERNRQKFVF